MSLPPPRPQGRRPGPPPAYAQVRIPQPPSSRVPQQAAYRPAQATFGATQREVDAPTLLQFWRSDSRVVPGRPRPRWAGRAAFWIGLLAAGLYGASVVLAIAFLAALAAPFAVVALAFALIAIIAGVGRGLGILGLLLALAGSTLFWSWLTRLFG